MVSIQFPFNYYKYSNFNSPAFHIIFNKLFRYVPR